MADSQGIVLFPIPQDPRLLKPSKNFMQAFNEAAKEYGITWQDSKNPLAVDAYELTVAPEFQAKYGLSESTPKVFSPTLKEDVTNILKKVEADRVAKVKEGSDSVQWIPYKSDLASLSPVEREAARLIVEELKPVINRISANQFDPQSILLAGYMAKNGSEEERRVFARANRDTCAGVHFDLIDPTCSLFPFMPDRPALNGMIRADELTDEKAFAEWSKQFPKDHQALRPTTVVERNEEGKEVYTPLPLHPDYREDHLLAANILEKIADLNVEGESLDPLFQDQLRAWAKFFRTGSAEDEAAAVQATIDAGSTQGQLRLHIGPSEGYWADNTKFPYLLQLGILDPQQRVRVQKAAESFSNIENALDGIPNYQPRRISTHGSFADPIYQIATGGFLESFTLREPLGNNFPNYDVYQEQYGVEGASRFILMEGVDVAVPTFYRSLSRLLDEDISDWEARNPAVDFIVDHETGHMAGPQRGHITPGGERMGAVFGTHWGYADEPKADLTNPVSAYLKRDQLTEKGKRNAALGALAWHFSNRYKGKKRFSEGMGDHYFGHLIQVGYLFKTGALTFVNRPGDGARRIHVDYDKVLESSYQLWAVIAAFQAAGDKEGYLQYAKDQVFYIPDEADQMILEASKDSPLFLVVREIS